jgi:hypothetical protein
MKRKMLLALALLPMLGCYRVTIVTGAPEAPQVIDKPWQHGFVYGLVPPSEIDTSQQCPQGVAKVVTEHSFVNSLAGILTWSLYTPIHVKVTCAAR